MGASAIGYVLGKSSYTSKMEDRFLAELPDSNVAKQIRIKRKLEPPEPSPKTQPDLNHAKHEPQASSLAPPSKLKSSTKGKYGDEGYEELEK